MSSLLQHQIDRWEKLEEEIYNDIETTLRKMIHNSEYMKNVDGSWQSYLIEQSLQGYVCLVFKI